MTRDYSDSIFRLVEYEVHCNLQAVTFLSGLTHEELHRDFGFGLRTPHRTIFHVADVMRGWSRSVAPVVERPAWLPYVKTMALDDIKGVIADIGAFWLTAAKASHELGVLADARRLDLLFHLVTHGTHHRGQLLSMITLMGHNQPFEGGDFGGWSNTVDE